MKINCLEDYQNLVDWYYENEYTEHTLHEDLYNLKFMAMAHVEDCIKQSYICQHPVCDTARFVKNIVLHYKEN